MALTNQQYHLAIRAKSLTLEKFPMIVSEDTDDGGKSGVLCEVTAWHAAKLLIDKKVRLATPEEAQAHRAAEAARRRSSLAHTAALDLKTHALKEGLLRLAVADISVPPPSSPPPPAAEPEAHAHKATKASANKE